MRRADDPPPEEFLASTESFWGNWDSEEVCDTLASLRYACLLANKTISKLPPVSFLSREEEDYLVAGLELQGFKTSKLVKASMRRFSNTS